MKSRMEKYYDSNEEFVGRAAKNENLYRKKDYSVYSSNETIIAPNNEIDITKLKDIIQSREDYQRAKSYRNMLSDKKFDYNDVPYEEDTYEEKNYDINEILKKVKDEKGNISEEDKIRKLRNTQYDILSNLNIKSKNQEEAITKVDLETQKAELQGLIDKVTKKNNIRNEEASLLNLEEQTDVTDENNDSALDLLSDLKSEGHTIVTDPIKPAAEFEVNKEELVPNEKDPDETSFYSDSFTFSKRDFEGLQDLEIEEKSGSGLIKLLIVILILIIIVVGVLVLDYFYHFLPFM